MKILAIIAVFALIVLSVYAVALLYQRAAQRRAERTAAWELQEESDGEQVIVHAVRKGTDDRLLVGAAPFAAQDFDMQLELLRSEGRQKLVTLNSERKALR